MVSRLAPAVFVLLLAGCHLRPLQHPAYHSDAYLRGVLTVVKLAPVTAEPRVELTDDLPTLSREWLSRGYVRIGRIAMRTKDEVSRGWLRDQAEAARADVVVATNTYLGTFPAQVSTPFGGTVIPVMQPRYRVEAHFLRRIDRAVCGVHTEDLSNADRFDLQRAGGAKIVAVYTASPAERAGLRPGDVITQAEDREIFSVGDFLQAQRDLAGRPVRLQFLRDGAPAEATVPFQAL